MSKINPRQRLFAYEYVVDVTHHAQELLYQTYVARTWRGRFKRLVGWIGKR